MASTDETAQDRAWTQVYRRLVDHFGQHGLEDCCGRGDFWVVADNYSWPSNKVLLFNLELLTVANIQVVQAMLADQPPWTVALVVDVVGKETEWPSMGVTVRQHEIIDGLLRKYLPERFRFFKIPGSRPGTGYD